MKILIYFVSFFVVNLIFRIISPPFQYKGNTYRVTGSIFTQILGGILGTYLWRLYSKRKIAAKAKKEEVKTFDAIKDTIPETLLEEFEECRGNADRLWKSVKYWRDQGKIDGVQAEIIYSEFKNSAEPQASENEDS